MPRMWFLEGFLDEAQQVPVRVPVRPLPFTIGRRPDSDLLLHSSGVSGRHAILRESGGALWVFDQGSRNGTTVNLDPVDTRGQRLEHGDVLDIARLKFKVVVQEGELLNPPADSDTLIGVLAPVRPFVHPRALGRVIDERNVTIHYQPLVALDTEAVVGWEALGRVAVDGLPSNPTDLFLAATELGRASELSRILRAEAVRGAQALPHPSPLLFVNTLPGEAASPALIPGIADLVAAHPDIQLVLEVHESEVTDVQGMVRLADALDALGVWIAYDDFGAGRTRLAELADAPPRYLKFDRALSAGLHRASAARRRLVRGLVEMALDFGVTPVAEGVESADDAAACGELGFVLAQGFHFGRPKPLT